MEHLLPRRGLHLPRISGEGGSKCQVKTCQPTAVVRDHLLTERKARNHQAPTLQELGDLRRLARVKDEAERTINSPNSRQVYDDAVTWSETSSTSRVEATKRRCQTLAAMRQRRSPRQRAQDQ